MKKINLANVEEFKPFETLKPDGYICGIYKVEDIPEKEYLKISYDIVEGEHKGFYSKLKKEKGWELPMFIASYKETALPFFKGTITSFEKSNKGFKFDDDEAKLKGKKVGLVLFEEEYLNNNGEVKVRLKVDKAHSVDAIKTGDFEVPERKCLSQVSANKTEQKNPFDTVVPQSQSADFQNIPDGIDEEEFPFPID